MNYQRYNIFIVKHKTDALTTYLQQNNIDLLNATYPSDPKVE